MFLSVPESPRRPPTSEGFAGGGLPALMSVLLCHRVQELGERGEGWPVAQWPLKEAAGAVAGWSTSGKWVENAHIRPLGTIVLGLE